MCKKSGYNVELPRIINNPTLAHLRCPVIPAEQSPQLLEEGRRAGWPIYQGALFKPKF